MDTGAQIQGLGRGSAKAAPVPSAQAIAVLERGLTDAKRDGESHITYEHALAAYDGTGADTLRGFSAAHSWPHTWRAAVASMIRVQARTEAPADDQVLTIDAAAALLSVHPQTLRQYIRQGRLRSYRMAGERAVRLRRTDVLGLLQ